MKKMRIAMMAAVLMLVMTGCGSPAETEGQAESVSESGRGDGDTYKTEAHVSDSGDADAASEPDGTGTSEGTSEPGNEEPGNEKSGNEEPGNEKSGNEKSGNEESGNEESEEGEHMEEIEIIQVPEWPQAEIPQNDALKFVESMRLGWCLGNTFDAVDCNLSDELQYESAWSKAVTTKEMIHAVADAGFRTIRIPVSWHNHVDEGWQISGAWMDRVQEVVDWALDEDMYVILNIHHDNGEDFMYPSYELLDQSKEYVSAVWKQIAARFADYDEKLVFETLNEPRQIGTDHEWWVDVNSEVGKECLDAVNQLNQVAVNTIREDGEGHNASRYIMVPGYCASPDFALAEDFALPEDPGGAENRILVSVHAYTPYNFALAGEGDSGSTDAFSVSEQKGTGEIDAFMERLYEKYISKGIGVVIGEFGARIKNGNTQARTEFAAYYVARARHYGISVCWWDNNAFAGNGENFGLLRRANCTFAFPQIVEQMECYSK